MRSLPIGKPGKTLTFAACVVVGCLFMAETIESTAPEAERLAAGRGAAESATDTENSPAYAATVTPSSGRFGSENGNGQRPSTDLQIADYEAPARVEEGIILASGGEGGFTERRRIPDLNEGIIE